MKSGSWFLFHAVPMKSGEGGRMEIATRKAGGAMVVSVTGRVDAVTAPEFEKGLSALIAGGDHLLVLNLNGLEYISSAGLRSILITAKQLKAKDGKVLFAGLKGPVKDVFKISGFGSLFKIFETEEEALRQT
jgi:anti-anti-sigma factor